MTKPPELSAARRWFADDIGAVAPVLRNTAIVDAFATVPREDYLGPGPWGMHSRLCIGEIHQSPTADARHLYHDVLVSIDEISGINNGLPSLWARVYDHLDIAHGATVCQIGAGVGYYTAILAELVSPSGRVIAYEIEPDLAARARSSLRHYANVDVICGDATQAEDMPEFDVLTACAGVTHIPLQWFEKLRRDGRLVLAFSGTDGWGFLLHLSKLPDRLPVRSLGPVGIYPCAGARLDAEAAAISKALKASGSAKPAIGHYRFGQAPPGADNIWLAGRSYWISTT
ncbi:MAG: methyltransferase domain-containing protein [Pseudomonadota bacterium]